MKPRVLNQTPDEIVIVDNENEEAEIPVEDNANVEQVDVLIKVRVSS